MSPTCSSSVHLTHSEVSNELDEASRRYWNVKISVLYPVNRRAAGKVLGKLSEIKLVTSRNCFGFKIFKFTVNFRGKQLKIQREHLEALRGPKT